MVIKFCLAPGLVNSLPLRSRAPILATTVTVISKIQRIQALITFLLTSELSWRQCRHPHFLSGIKFQSPQKFHTPCIPTMCTQTTLRMILFSARGMLLLPLPCLFTCPQGVSRLHTPNYRGPPLDLRIQGALSPLFQTFPPAFNH